MRALARPALACALLAASGCGGPSHPNLLLIVVDTLRADHLGAYGYERDTSPAIDALAARSALFRRAYSAAPWTQPSVATMLTGLHPSSHGVDRLMRVLPDSADTLAEILARAGYATSGVVSHGLIGSRFHFDQGFERFEEVSGGADALTTPSVTSRAVRELEIAAGAERPFFLFVHYFDPHYSYRRHPEYGFARERVERLDGDEDIWDLRRLEPAPDEAERAFLRDLYDEEIRFTDSGVGRLLGALERLGADPRTLVVLVADHGEEFFERGWLGHTRSLYDELIRVPLLIRLPGGRGGGRVVEAPVSLVSLAPTLLDLMGIEAAGAGFQGASFAGRVRGARADEAPAVYAEVDRYDEGVATAGASPPADLPPRTMLRKRALVDGRYKLVHDRLSGAYELYDLERDPAEREDLAAREPDRVRRLAAALDAAATAAAGRRLPRMGAERIRSEAETRRLIELGYVSP